MRTPVIMIFLVCVLIMGIVALAVYDYKRRGFRTEGPGISKSEADTLRRTREKGDELFEKQDYKSAIMKYEQASEMAPRDRKSTRLNSSHIPLPRMPSSA